MRWMLFFHFADEKLRHRETRYAKVTEQGSAEARVLKQGQTSEVRHPTGAPRQAITEMLSGGA